MDSRTLTRISSHSRDPANLRSISATIWLSVKYGRKRNPYDNAVMESFYCTLKRELVHDTNYENIKQDCQRVLARKMY